MDEVRHEGAVAMASQSSELAHGDTTVPLPLRSTAKPFILGALLETVLSGETFSDIELALMSSSHNGEPAHVAVVVDLLRRYGISPEVLRCGVQPKWRDWSIQSPLGNNCSGKHTAFLISSAVAGYPLQDYVAADSPLNRLVIERLESIYGETVYSVGVDGCSLPTCAFSLKAMARAYRDYASDTLGSEIARVRAAHRAAGFYVAGTDRLESHLITRHGLAAKSGSDGLWTAGVPGRGIGIAVKVWSGLEAAAQAVLLDVLQRYDVLQVAADDYLVPYYTQARRSLSGGSVGTFEVCSLPSR